MILKKPKFWDYKKPNLIAFLLFPITIIIKIINFLGKKKSKKKFNIKTICIGNIYLGGTGKTSLSIKLNHVLNNQKLKTCFVKKFYKNQIDEQKLLERKGKLFSASYRIDALKQAEHEKYEYAILDDGLQDSSIYYDYEIVCFNNLNWIGNGMTIPSGPLRENIKNLKKYKYLFLNGNLENVDNLKQDIYKINPNIKIHLGIYEPTNLEEFSKNEKYFVFSGIGNHQTFISMIKKNGLRVLKDIEYPDHYGYTNNDIKNVLREANKLGCKVITTEKDFQRINILDEEKIKIMKVQLKIIDEDKFINSIIKNEKY